MVSAGTLSRSQVITSPRLTSPGCGVAVSVQARYSACAASAASRHCGCAAMSSFASAATKRDRRGVDRQMRPIHPAEFLGAGMNVHQLGQRRGAVEQRIALRRNFAEPPADQHQQIRRLGARHQLRIRPEPEIAGVARMQRIEQRAAAIAGRDRQAGARRDRLDLLARLQAPAAAAEHDQRPLGIARAGPRVRPSLRRRARSRPAECRRIGRR